MPSTETPAPPQPDPPLAPANKGGRPGITRDQVADAVDTWVARTGHAPSVRELRTALGETGSLSTLGRHLRDVLGDRLLTGAEPERGSPEEIVIKSLKAAMGLLAGDAASAADDAIALGAREADSRIAAAEGLQARAEARTQVVEQERERALGRAGALDEQVASLKAEVADVRQTLADSHAREANDKTLISELEQSLRSVQDERRELEEAQINDRRELAQTNTDRDAIHIALATTESALAGVTAERDAARSTSKKLEEALQQAKTEKETIQETLATTQSALATASAERNAAQGTSKGLQQALHQSEKRTHTAGTGLAEAAIERDSLRETVNQLWERHAAVEKELALAQSSAIQACKERDAVIAERDRLGEIRETLALLQKKMDDTRR